MQEQVQAGARGLRPEVYPDAEQVSLRAARFIADRVRARPDLLLCAATGGTPTRTYERLVDLSRAEPGLFDALRVVKLDEWSGLSPQHPGTCEAYLRTHLVGPLGLPDDRYLAFRSDAPDPEAECRRIEHALVQEGPIDVCVLGLGTNGHLALNEPAAALTPFPHVARLSEETRRHPMIRDVQTDVGFGLTLGMADILQSKQILLLVTGANKRDVLGRLLAGGVSTERPASLLWLHGAVTLLCDQAAAPFS